LPVLFVALPDQLFRAYDESSLPDAMICRPDAPFLPSAFILLNWSLCLPRSCLLTP